jgi:hypothetical protein
MIQRRIDSSRQWQEECRFRKESASVFMEIETNGSNMVLSAVARIIEMRSLLHRLQSSEFRRDYWNQ